ncbi:MAG: sigma-70 family RNA polymerase sigma factor [Phycisphaerae bacterium]|nr:sigma-70 family RNA polymerase sigma factor [Phycisphaerae bacterium]
MINPESWIEWIERAKQGDPDSRDRLAEFAAERLRNHLFRMTLRHDVTEDLVQETVLEMMKILGKLKQTERFLPWLYGIALNKLRSHRRTEYKHHNPKDLQFRKPSAGQEPDGLEKLIGNELRQVVTQAMQSISERHRTILSLRCFEELSYAEISQVMGCSEFAAQMLFLRAKRSLAKELGRYGLGRGALIMALVLFGKMTAATQAAALRVSVPAASLKVGLAASIAGIVTTKVAILSMSAGTLLVAGSAIVDTPLSKIFSRKADMPVVQTMASMDGPGKMEEGDESRWMYFPEGANGPLMLRVARLGADNGECVSLQNSIGNYHYDASARTVYLDNWRRYRPDLSATILPGDSPALTKILTGGSASDRVATPDRLHFATPQQGLLVIEDSQAGRTRSQIEQHLNLLEEEYFQSNWPATIRRADRRDEAHAQGWTRFRVVGQIDSHKVRGNGCIPFVYSAVRNNRPWLDLTIGGERLIDTAAGSERIGSDGRVERFPSGRFFEGLMRPWMGLHTIDRVRRDAALRGIGSDIQRVDEDLTTVTVRKGDLEIRYTISLNRDWVESITLQRGNRKGILTFSYPSSSSDSKTEPTLIPSSYYHDQAGEWWLMEILE